MPTLGWGYVQTSRRREKRCPQYRVLGQLRFKKDLAQKTIGDLSRSLVIVVEKKPQHLGFPRGPPPWY
jgi:hypothetical protein